MPKPVHTRSDDANINLLEYVYKDEDSFTSSGKLKSGAYVMGRIHYLTTLKKGVSLRDICKVAGEELYYDWIDKNVYPKKLDNIQNQLETLYKKWKDYRHTAKYKKKHSEKWVKEVTEFNKSLHDFALDISTPNTEYRKKLENEFGVKMTDEEVKFYENNCKGSYTYTCTNNVSQKWKKQRDRLLKRKASAEDKVKKSKELTQEEKKSKKRQYDELLEDVEATCDDPTDSSFHVEKPVKVAASESKMKTRSTSLDMNEENDAKFPPVYTRSGYRVMNESLMRCATQCLAEYKVSANDLSGIMIKTANIIFGQQWELNDETEVDGDDNDDDDNDCEDQEDMRYRKYDQVKNRFPSRRTLNAWLEDAAMLNLKFVAENILNKEDNVVTVGIDDTSKAAGHKLYNVKADNITMSGKDMKRKTFTTGYSEVASKAGADNAKVYEGKLKCLAALAGTTVDEIKNHIDFWMTDRAGDNNTMFESLGVDVKSVLKCCGHIILGVDHAADKVFKNVEQRIGVQKLLNTTAGQKAFLSPSTSIHTLGQIAISKLLSPSHAAHSVSLYTEYIQWMNENNIKHEGFHGFTANRFGRIAEIAKEFVARRDSIIQFFEECVNINSNKLVLAVGTYIQNNWFHLCCRVYERIGFYIIFPLMELLGIDKAYDVKREDRNWSGVREFFKEKIPELERLRDEGVGGNGEDMLMTAVLDEILETLHRQLNEVSYFSDEETITAEAEEKMKYAALTNSGCESQFAKLNNRLNVSGGTAPVETLSRKNIVATNAFLVDSSFQDLSDEERKQQWKFARTSENVKEVRNLQKDLLQTLETNKVLALEKKKQLKLKSASKTLTMLEKCKLHGGPVTMNSINLLKDLTTDQLLSEVSYLRSTIAPDIRQMRRVQAPGGKYKMEKYTQTELVTSIKNAIHPVADIVGDVSTVLKEALMK